MTNLGDQRVFRTLPGVGGGDVDCYLDVVGGLVCLFDLKRSGQRNQEGSDRL
jgi:hypothetical protein